MAEIMLYCRSNGRRWLGRSLKRLLDEGYIGLLRHNWWRMMMMIIMQNSFDVTSNVSFLRGPTHSYVTSPQDRSPQDRYLTSHRYSAQPTRLPSPTAEPAPEALLTRSEFPFVVTSIHCYNRHVWSYSFFFYFLEDNMLWRRLICVWMALFCTTSLLETHGCWVTRKRDCSDPRLFRKAYSGFVH